jgi:hypothetical protein
MYCSRSCCEHVRAGELATQASTWQWHKRGAHQQPRRFPVSSMRTRPSNNGSASSPRRKLSTRPSRSDSWCMVYGLPNEKSVHPLGAPFDWRPQYTSYALFLQWTTRCWYASMMAKASVVGVSAGVRFVAKVNVIARRRVVQKDGYF